MNSLLYRLSFVTLALSLAGCGALQSKMTKPGTGASAAVCSEHNLTPGSDACDAYELQNMVKLQRQVDPMNYVKKERWIKQQGKSGWPDPVLKVLAYTSSDATLEQRRRVNDLMKQLPSDLRGNDRDLLVILQESNQQQLGLIKLIQDAHSSTKDQEAKIAELQGKIDALTAIEQQLAPAEDIAPAKP
ncbi:hypothetical protein ACKC9G_11715 [Pokkaliibacter sp. CJK22405]|uniref:hypothetical protein n=1 Tax=Pokkaliibacter sp. CJK22405 TaxID=3384615 RepID=UPI0039851CF2